MIEGEKMIDILDDISGFDTQTRETMLENDSKIAEATFDTCPLCDGDLEPIGILDNYNIICKCKKCGLAVFR